MANPTTNYGFVLPTATDLVTDLPADFDVALQGVDTRLKALQPGTTLGDLAYSSATANTNTRLPIGTNGQVLAVVGGVPAWSSEAGDISSVTAGTGISGGGTSGDVTITNSMATAIDAKGDLIAGTGADAFSRLAVGTNNQVLTADSTTATGLKWATASSGSLTQLATGSISGSSVSITSISGSYKDLVLEIYNISFATAGELRFTFNNVTSTYGYTTISAGVATSSGGGGAAYGSFGGNVQTFGDNVHAVLSIPFYSTSSARQLWTGQIGGVNGSNGGPSASFTTGMAYNSAQVITSIQFFPQSGNFNSAGTYVLYGVN